MIERSPFIQKPIFTGPRAAMANPDEIVERMAEDIALKIALRGRHAAVTVNDMLRLGWTVGQLLGWTDDSTGHFQAAILRGRRMSADADAEMDRNHGPFRAAQAATARTMNQAMNQNP